MKEKKQDGKCLFLTKSHGTLADEALQMREKKALELFITVDAALDNEMKGWNEPESEGCRREAKERLQEELAIQEVVFHRHLVPRKS